MKIKFILCLVLVLMLLAVPVMAYPGHEAEELIGKKFVHYPDKLELGVFSDGEGYMQKADNVYREQLVDPGVVPVSIVLGDDYILRNHDGKVEFVVTRFGVMRHDYIKQFVNNKQIYYRTYLPFTESPILVRTDILPGPIYTHQLSAFSFRSGFFRFAPPQDYVPGAFAAWISDNFK